MYSTKKSRHGSASGANPRAGRPKMMGGAMLAPRGLGHYESQAHGLSGRVDGHIPGAPHSGAIPKAGASGAGGLKMPPMPKPKMGSRGGRGGF